MPVELSDEVRVGSSPYNSRFLIYKLSTMTVLSKHQQRVVGLVLVGGSALVGGGRVLQLNIRRFQKEQSALCEIQSKSAAQQASQPKKAKVS